MKLSEFSSCVSRMLTIFFLAAIGLCSSPASAATDAGMLSLTPFVYSSPLLHGSFTDSFTFEMPSLSDLAASAVSLDMQAGDLSILHINDLAFSFFDSSNNLMGSSGGNTANFLLPLGSGSYRANVSGNASGLSGGAYLFSIAAVPDNLVNTAPIPEPEAWMSLLSGLALLVPVMRRRMKRS